MANEREGVEPGEQTEDRELVAPYLAGKLGRKEARRVHRRLMEDDEFFESALPQLVEDERATGGKAASRAGIDGDVEGDR